MKNKIIYRKLDKGINLSLLNKKTDSARNKTPLFSTRKRNVESDISASKSQHNSFNKIIKNKSVTPKINRKRNLIQLSSFTPNKKNKLQEKNHAHARLECRLSTDVAFAAVDLLLGGRDQDHL